MGITLKGQSPTVDNISLDIDEDEEVVTSTPIKPKMVTLPQGEIEDIMLSLKSTADEATKTIDTAVEAFQRQQYDFNNLCHLFNSLNDHLQSLEGKIEATDSYEAYLQKCVENHDLSKQTELLQIALNKEKAEVTQFIIELKDTVSTKFNVIEDALHDFSSKANKSIDSLSTADDIITGHVTAIGEELIQADNQMTGIVEQKLGQIETSTMTSMNTLKDDYKKELGDLLNKFNENVKSTQNYCSDVLGKVKNEIVTLVASYKTQQSEVEKSMKKIPNLQGVKDKTIFFMAGISVLSCVAQFLLILVGR